MTVLQFPLERVRQVDLVRVLPCPQSVGDEPWFSVDGFLRGRQAIHFGIWPDLDQACSHARDLAGRHKIPSILIEPDAVVSAALDEIRVRARVWPGGGEFWSIDGFRRGRLFQNFGFWPDIGDACHHAYGLAADHGVIGVQIVGAGEENDEDG